MQLRTQGAHALIGSFAACLGSSSEQVQARGKGCWSLGFKFKRQGGGAPDPLNPGVFGILGAGICIFHFILPSGAMQSSAVFPVSGFSKNRRPKKPQETLGIHELDSEEITGVRLTKTVGYVE